MDEIQKALKDAMAERSMTNLDLAFVLRVHPSQITKWFKPGSNMTVGNLIRVAHAVGLEVKLTKL